MKKLLSQFLVYLDYCLGGHKWKKAWYNITHEEHLEFSKDTDLDQESTEEIKEYLDKVREPKQLEQPAVELNLDTGKILLPDNLSAEDKAAVESALAELQKSLQNFTSDQFQSLEDFLSKSSDAFIVPFTKANDLPDAQLQVLEEIENCKDDTDHWSDSDFIEALFGFYNQGYDFPGIEVMANKVNEKLELTKNEQKQLRDWYMLASQELVYDV